MGEDQSILRWGGVSGLLAGILIIVIAITMTFLGGPATTEGLLIRVRDMGRVYLVLPGLRTITYLLPIPLFIALHRATRTPRPMSAILGAVLGVSGALVVAANWAMALVGLPTLVDAYVQASAADRPMVVLVAQAWEQVTHAFQFFGGFLLGLGFAFVGRAMLARTDIKRGYGAASLILGLAAAVSWLIAVGIGGETGPIIIFLFIGFLATLPLYFLLGWKAYSLSRTS